MEAQHGSGDRPGEVVTGLLLCRAADGRLAFRARDVVMVDAWLKGSPVPHARTAFGFSPQPGRSLVAAEGDAIGVDEVSVFAEPVPLLGAPALLQTMLGGSLLGFVLARDLLWPVLALAQLSRSLVVRTGAPR